MEVAEVGVLGGRNVTWLLLREEKQNFLFFAYHLFALHDNLIFQGIKGAIFGDRVCGVCCVHVLHLCPGCLPLVCRPTP